MNSLLTLKPLTKGLIVSGVGAALYNLYSYNNNNNLYTSDQVSKHNTPDDIWITRGDKVYNITKFIDSHPGGKETILMAAGDSVDYYWNLYKQHNTDYVKNILKQYEIGTLTNYKKEDFENEYTNEPKRYLQNHIIHKKEPFNAELKTDLLLNNYITPENKWFTRNHHPVPNISIYNYQLYINGKPYKYNEIMELKQNDIISTIQCAGNRRSELNSIDKTMGLPWGGGAISNGKWTGVWLDQIVKIPKNKKYINLYDYNQNFSVSIPINAKVLLANKLNDEILTKDRGFPIRVIVPGYTGSKNVKWVEIIEFSDKEVESPWQAGIAYKKFPNNIKTTLDITQLHKSEIPTIDTLPIQSYITNKNIMGDNIKLLGYAISGGGKKIVSVEISNDGGKTWSAAKISNGAEQISGYANSWVFWEILLKYDKTLSYKCRATDEVGDIQQMDNKSNWNIRGISNNSIHKI